MAVSVKTSKLMTYDDGLAFLFDFPNDLSLSAVDVIDGVPKLRFVHSLHVPSITEEDVAVCVRLCQEKKRPEFFYIPFPPNHPFYGRHYKDYLPSYLRGTSIGELLAEADWLMKCLDAGVKSDETKTKFWSWAETSRLDGLATSEYFSATASHGSIFMMCKSVEVDKSEEEMLFSDLKMAINATNSSSYSKYLTEIFDAIAYYDEPLFLKMKELIKLILAVEWFNEKGVKFSTQWVDKHLSRTRMSARQVIAVRSPKLSQKIIESVLKQFGTVPFLALPIEESSRVLQMPFPWLPPVQIATSKTMTEKAFQMKHVYKIDALGIRDEFTLTISIDDFDVLYQGMNPNTSISYHDEKGQLSFTIPDVESWSQLFAETVPIPCKGLLTSNREMVDIVYGGVTTRNIPVKNAQKLSVVKEQEVVARASPNRQKQRPKCSEIPVQQFVIRPSSHAVCDHQQRSLASAKHDVKPTFGIKDRLAHTRSLGGGKVVEQQQTVKISAIRRLSVRGQVYDHEPILRECVVPSDHAPAEVEAEETDGDIPVAMAENPVGSKKSPNGGSPTGSDDESIISDDKVGNSGIMSPTDGLLSPTDKPDDGSIFEFTSAPDSSENKSETS